ncbi:hypothetical protein A2U01_0110385, partial [Trifolium medium]|nr:hypothetical protein [Trifolium medium]
MQQSPQTPQAQPSSQPTLMHPVMETIPSQQITATPDRNATKTATVTEERM